MKHPTIGEARFAFRRYLQISGRETDDHYRSGEGQMPSPEMRELRVIENFLNRDWGQLRTLVEHDHALRGEKDRTIAKMLRHCMQVLEPAPYIDAKALAKRNRDRKKLVPALKTLIDMLEKEATGDAKPPCADRDT